jgi:ubiquinone/menaquinone biosynthesis C-methylase UbiE
MHFFDMIGAWGRLEAKLYNVVVMPALREIYGSMIERYLPLAGLREGALLVDVGCGAGHATALVGRRFTGLRIVGVDLSGEMLARARRETAVVPGVKLLRGDAMRLPIADASFDVAVSMASIKHWPDRARGVAEMFRVLRPGGRAFIMEVDRLASRETSMNFIRTWKLTPFLVRPVVLRYFMRIVVRAGLTVQELADLGAGAGFTGVDAQRHGTYPGVMMTCTRP